MKLTEMSSEVFNYVEENGGRVSIDELASATGRSTRSVGANVTDLTKKNLCVREKVTVEGAEKPVTYVQITDEGKAFVPTEE